MNALEIDQGQVEASFDTLEAQAATTAPGAPGAEPAPGEVPPAADTAVDWSIAAQGIVNTLDKFVCPAWRLTEAEKAAAVEPIATAGALWMPVIQASPRMQALGAVLVVFAAIAMSRWDSEAGELMPMRHKREAKASSSSSSSSPPPAAKETNKRGGAAVLDDGLVIGGRSREH